MQPSPASEPGHYHLSVHTISKLKGDSVLAMAAYRHAERFCAEPQSITHAAAYQRAQRLGNDGKVFDYRRKIGVAWTGIIAPDCTPKELLDAQTLWNTVERIECRKNARLAREMIIALPHQVDLDIHVAMLRAFITSHLTARGMIADVAIHRPPVEHGGDLCNWHAHVLLTDRPITAAGFAATKDRMWNAKENLLLWRKAWADTHNATMQHLGLPHRIDHRSLEAQRQDALARGDTMAALELDREPQIHVGKAHHVRHPDRNIYVDRRARNEAILTRNKDRAGIRADRMRSHIAAADNDAFNEARQITFVRDTLGLDDPTLAELHTEHGRPAPTTTLDRLRAAMLRSKADARAMEIAKAHGFPWRASGQHRADAPSVFDVVKPIIATTRSTRPVFTVTAKDIAFALYGWGWLSARDLQASLESIALEEHRLAAERGDGKNARPPPQRSPPTYPTPKADHLARLRKVAHMPENAYLRRLEQLQAFRERHQAQAYRKAQCRAIKAGRRMGRGVMRNEQPPGTG